MLWQGLCIPWCWMFTIFTMVFQSTFVVNNMIYCHDTSIVTLPWCIFYIFVSIWTLVLTETMVTIVCIVNMWFIWSWTYSLILTELKMTRWARANNVHKHKAADATPWKQLKASGKAGEAGTSAGGRYVKQGPGVKKHNKKKQEHDTDDVNGFLEYLKQTGQTPEDQDLREEVATALKKDTRRENRRIKRQDTKKNNMVRSRMHVTWLLWELFSTMEYNSVFFSPRSFEFISLFYLSSYIFSLS